MPSYKEYLVGNFRTGLYTHRKPWMAPDEAFPVLVDAYVDGGVLKRRLGSTAFATISANPIVGFAKIPYAGYNEVIVCDTKRAYNLHKNAETTDISLSDLFSGGEDDYFWFQEYTGCLYMCNGVDAIYKHTPGYGDQYSISAMATTTVTIQSCRMLLSHKNRLLIVSPKIGGVWYPDYIYYTDVNLDTVGATNYVRCQDAITPISGGYIGEIPVIFTQEGAVYHVTYTFNSDAPFTWERKTQDAGVRAKMGTAVIRDKLATIGLNRLVSYDRFQAKPFDTPIRGLLDGMDQQKIVNSYTHRFTDRDFLGIAYTRDGQSDHDRMLLYNVEEGSFSRHTLAPNCLFSINGPWLNKGVARSYPVPDSDYQQYEFMGTKAGKVVRINHSNVDVGGNISPDIRSAQLNPYSKEGRAVDWGWVKLLIEGNYGMGLSVRLYKNHSGTPFKTVEVKAAHNRLHLVTVWLDGEVADFFRMRLVHTYSNDAAGDLTIHGFIFGFKPAGPMSHKGYEAATAITTNWRWYHTGTSLQLQYYNSDTWEMRREFEPFSGTFRVYDDETHLRLQELVDGTYTTRFTWEGVTGDYSWDEDDSDNLILVLGGATKWTVEA